MRPASFPGSIGRIADLDWLARAEFIDESSSLFPVSPPRRERRRAAFPQSLDIRAVPDLPPGPWPIGIDRIGEVRSSLFIANHHPVRLFLSACESPARGRLVLVSL